MIMARRLTFLLVAFGLVMPQLLSAAEIPVLAYHDIVAGNPADDFAVSTDTFREQMEYLHRRGYTPISLRSYSEAAVGKTQLPKKPILLTFDDGMKSFQTMAMPVLETFGYPAAVSVVTGWLDGRDVPENLRGRILDWDDLRALGSSPLVEILAHSDALHADVRADSSGTKGPAAVTHRYIESTGKVEKEDVYRSRIRLDLERAAGRIRSETGRSPSGIAWPYGFYNQPIADDAGTLGMTWQLSISGEPARLADYPHIRRIPVYKVRSLRDFEHIISQKVYPPKVALAVNLDESVRLNKAERHRWLSDLLERLVILQVDALIVTPPGANSEATQESLGVLAPENDFLLQVLHSTRVRAGVRYVWLQIPTAQRGMRVHKYLARYHIYDGILVPKSSTAEDAARLQVIYREYRPGLRCGTVGQSTDSSCKDFTVMEIALAEIAGQDFSSHSGDSPVYYLPHEGPLLNGANLLAAISALRRKGVRQVVVPYRVLANHPQTLVPIAVELSRLVSRKD